MTMSDAAGSPDRDSDSGADRENEPRQERVCRADRVDGWSYAGITDADIRNEPTTIDAVTAIQQRPTGTGDHTYREATLTPETRVGPVQGGHPDHRDLDTDNWFQTVGVVALSPEAPLADDTALVMAEVGFDVADPRWYWVPLDDSTDLQDPPRPAETDTCEEGGSP
mgnify:CR=1 FL=1